MKALIEIPKKTKALNLKAVGELVYDEIDLPELPKQTALVKIMACGICSSDIERVFETGTYHFPTVIGHEFSGQIVAVADDENEELLGKKAVVFPLLPCKECEACKKEDYAVCSNYNYFGSRCDGGFSQYLVVPIWNLILFENISYEQAAMCEPTAVALHATKRAEIKEGDEVLIVGSGTIAFLIGTFCKLFGAKVIMAARRLESLELAQKYGFIPVLNDENVKENLKEKIGEDSVKIAFEVVGSNDAINTTLALAKEKVVMVGNPKEDVFLQKDNYWRILRKQLTVIGTWNSSFNAKNNDWKEVLKLLNENKIDLTDLITEVYDMEDYQEAFERVKGKSLTYKIILRPNGGEKNEKR